MILAYHELTAVEAAYAYSLTNSRFRQHLEVLAGGRWEDVEITFDDGHASQFDTAAVLEQFGRRGIYFVTVGWMGQRAGYLNWPQLRELTARGHRVEAHGWHHKFLTQCTPQELDAELRQARETLEDRLQRPVEALSAPGGRWSARVAEACAQAGYRTLFLSDPWMKPGLRHGIELQGRYMVRRTLDGPGLERLLTMPAAKRRWHSLKYRAKEGLRCALGDARYQRLWTFLSRHPAQ
jgi:peptidoglycan/xylan/chitin deacetylase (PgdA/CDA1 family)